MNQDEPYYQKKVQKFSVVKKCPSCGQLALSSKNSSIYCTNCNYEEKVPVIS